MLKIFLLVSGIVLLACVFMGRISDKTGIPALLGFIFLGMLFGTDGILKIPYDNFASAEDICGLALIFIIFSDGLNSNWNKIKPVFGESLLISTIGVFICAFATGIFCHYALGYDWYYGILLGAVLAPTDAAAVFSILKSKKISIKYGSSQILETESGSNDPCSYLLTMLMISAMKGEFALKTAIIQGVEQMFFGAVIGLALGFYVPVLLKQKEFQSSNIETIFLTAAAMLSYGIADIIGGSGFLSVYLFSLCLGASSLRKKREMRQYFSNCGLLFEIICFFLLGLLSTPSRMGKAVLPALALVPFLALGSRLFMLSAILLPFKKSFRQILFLSFSGLRGASSIIFAISAMLADRNISPEFFNIVFVVVIISIFAQGTFLPFAAKKLGMINAEEESKDISEYVNGSEKLLSTSEFNIPHDSLWIGKTIKSLQIPPETLFLSVIRNNTKFTPTGDTQFMEGDRVLMCAKAPEFGMDAEMTEVAIDSNSEWNGLKISELNLEKGTIIAAVQRGEKIIVPNGNIKIKAGDVVIIELP